MATGRSLKPLASPFLAPAFPVVAVVEPGGSTGEHLYTGRHCNHDTSNLDP